MRFVVALYGADKCQLGNPIGLQIGLKRNDWDYNCWCAPYNNCNNNKLSVAIYGLQIDPDIVFKLKGDQRMGWNANGSG